ncbi:MAG: hypothetical protein ACKO2F_00240 [Cyanobacteriota bacterium]
MLIDRVITDLKAAVPVKALERFFARWLKVEPSRDLMFKLITTSELFNLTSILSLASKLACDTLTTLEWITPKAAELQGHGASGSSGQRCLG